MTRLLLPAIILLLSACLFVGDAAIKITADIADEREVAYKNCSIDLLTVRAAKLHRIPHLKRQISFRGTRFEQLFIIDPARQGYVVEIMCSGSDDVYRSELLQPAPGIEVPVYLGRIVLKRNAAC